jgi:hypothetical protein
MSEYSATNTKSACNTAYGTAATACKPSTPFTGTGAYIDRVDDPFMPYLTNVAVPDRQPYQDNKPTSMMNAQRFDATLSVLESRMLTIVDASLTDDRQRTAVKDLIQEAFRTTRNDFGSSWDMDESEHNEEKL